MLSSEKKSLFRFLAIYLSSTFLLFSLASWIFYLSAKHHLLDHQAQSLEIEAAYLKNRLRLLHQSDAPKLVYPKRKGIDSAIYDLDKGYIFGTVDHNLSYDAPQEKTKLYHKERLQPYYLGAAYMLLMRDIDEKPIVDLQRNILLFMLAGGIFFSILGYFLGRLFVAPMRQSIEQMNQFIQDTTHELNTPISTILTNIEMIETFEKHPQSSAELTRIAIASKTLSRIYDDLTYLSLNHNYHRQIVSLDMSQLLHERILYFEAMIEAKSLRLSYDIQSDVILEIDRNDALRLIDNLLSNAIKYNRPGGTLHIALNQNYFLVKDSGIGINRKDLESVKKRFKRASKSEGGFGIGLNIVDQVVRSYGFTIEINSKENSGTEVWIRWSK